jgi:hypothetical protein
VAPKPQHHINGIGIRAVIETDGGARKSRLGYAACAYSLINPVEDGTA